MKAGLIARALGGRRVARGWTARCPAHRDDNPSLSIRDAGDGAILLRCHVGCGQEQVISLLRSRGLWTSNGPRSRPTLRPNVQHEPDQDDTKRTEVALTIWQATKQADNTVVESYLASRGLHLPLVSTLRLHVGLRHTSGGIWPMMVALVKKGADGTPLAIHRTYLARDGAGKAPVEPANMMLGPCRGGAVRLALTGAFAGTHRRYVLISPVRIVEDTAT